jgi:hypothetical protein
MKENLYIAGIGGKDRSGKDLLAKKFMDAGLFGFSFGDAVRVHTRERHHDKPDSISVANMTETSNWLRGKHGADVILQQALKEFETESKAGKQYKGIVLYSVRAPVEVDFILRRHGDLIWVQSDDSVRLMRKNTNLRDGEVPVTLEQMLAQEELQMKPQPGTPIEAQMDLSYVQERATIVLENNGNNIEEFEVRSEALVQERLSAQEKL